MNVPRILLLFFFNFIQTLFQQSFNHIATVYGCDRALNATLSVQPQEHQIILRASGYLTPTKCNALGKIIFSFFGLSKDTPQKENYLGKTNKTERKSTKKPWFM